MSKLKPLNIVSRIKCATGSDCLSKHNKTNKTARNRLARSIKRLRNTSSKGQF